MSRNIFVYCCGASLILIFFTYLGVPIAGVSWIPSLFGDPFTIGHLFSQTIELIAFAFLSFIGYGKRKIFHLIIFLIFVVTLIACMFDGSCIDVFTFVISAVGIILTFPCFREYADYIQLTNTEGWPHFSKYLAEAEEHPTFSTRYISEYYTAHEDKIIPPEGSVPEPEPTEPISFEMPDISPIIKEMPPLETICRSEPELPDESFFEPDCGLSDEIYTMQ